MLYRIAKSKSSGGHRCSNNKLAVTNGSLYSTSDFCLIQRQRRHYHIQRDFRAKRFCIANKLPSRVSISYQMPIYTTCPANRTSREIVRFRPVKRSEKIHCVLGRNKTDNRTFAAQQKEKKL